MTWVAAAVFGGAVVGAAGSSIASKKAADSAEDINDKTLDYQERIYRQNREDFKPYADLGKKYLPAFERMLNTEGNSTQELSPLAKWQQQEFLKTQNRQDAARGLAGSGSASARIGEGTSAIAANDYQAQYMRILDALKIGTGATAATGNSALQYSSQVGQNGQNAMGIAMENGNTNANLWQGLGSLPMDYLSLQSRMPSGGGTSPTPTYYPSGGSSSLAPAATSTSRFGDISLM